MITSKNCSYFCSLIFTIITVSKLFIRGNIRFSVAIIYKTSFLPESTTLESMLTLSPCKDTAYILCKHFETYDS